MCHHWTMYNAASSGARRGSGVCDTAVAPAAMCSCASDHYGWPAGQRYRYSTYDAEGTWYLRNELERLLKTRPWAQV